MKYLLLLLALSMSAYAGATDYLDAKITGYGLLAGESKIRFTIDKDPNVILLTSQFVGESEHNRIVSMIIAAYTAQSPIAFLRSNDPGTSTVRHYAEVQILEVGSITHD
jgi:hypothetical protein